MVTDGIGRVAYPCDGPAVMDRDVEEDFDLFVGGGNEEDHVVDGLIVVGADETEAKRFAAKVTASAKPEIFFEV